MPSYDATQLDRTAQVLWVHIDPVTPAGSSGIPSHTGTWRETIAAQVETVAIHAGGKPSAARVFFPGLRWDEDSGIRKGDRIRITAAPSVTGSLVPLFSGFVVRDRLGFSGGEGSSGRETTSLAHETNGFLALDHRWLLDTTCPIFGQVARSADDYLDFAASPWQDPQFGKYTRLTGRRCVFNADSQPNRDPALYQTREEDAGVALFADTDRGEYWRARDILRYLAYWCKSETAYAHYPWSDPATWPGIDHADWDAILYHVSCEGLSLLESFQLLAEKIGWSFREDYTVTGQAYLTFYKIGAAATATRASTAPTIQHRLYAPPAGESVAVGVAQGQKMLWTLRLDEDIASVVNQPLGLGAPRRVEITTELVPAWPDSLLTPDTTGDANENLYYTESEIAELEYPQSKTYVNRYHTRGASFATYRDVGRRWALNESGRYTGTAAPGYDRGAPWDPRSVIDLDWCQDKTGRLTVAPLRRQLLPCLTESADGAGSIGILVEFSFDGGSTWHAIPAAIESLPDEAGIWIADANLAEIAPVPAETISGGDLDGMSVNLWTSLCADSLAGNEYKDGEWSTRCRVTCSIQLDQRLRSVAPISDRSGSPFAQSRVYNFSDDYRHSARCDSSQYATATASSLTVDADDDRSRLNARLAALRAIHEDAAVSGMFVLDRLWTGPDAYDAGPDFRPGDAIVAIEGRSRSLAASFGNRSVYPEIIAVTYDAQTQRQELITRDLRFETRRL